MKFNSVYDVEKLKKLYDLQGHNEYNKRWNIVPSPEQDLLYIRVAHEHAIFKRHVTTVLKIVGPFVADVCYMQFPDFQGISLFLRIPFTLFLGYAGGECIGEVV